MRPGGLSESIHERERVESPRAEVVNLDHTRRLTVGQVCFGTPSQKFSHKGTSPRLSHRLDYKRHHPSVSRFCRTSKMNVM